MKITANTIDIERCVRQVRNKFDLILIAATRARDLARSQNDNKNKGTVQALHEIELGLCGRDQLRRVGSRKKR